MNLQDTKKIHYIFFKSYKKLIFNTRTNFFFYFQLHLLAKQDRLQFEYSTLVGETEIFTKDIEVMMLPLGTKPTEAKFLIRIVMDYSQLPPRINKSQNDEAMLIVTFCGPDWNRILPQLYLSKTLEDIFGGPESLHIPPFPPNKYLMDYVPEVKKFIQEKVQNFIYIYIVKDNTIYEKKNLYVFYCRYTM